MKNNFIARIKEILQLIDMVKARVSFFPEYNPPLYVTGVHGQTNQATLHLSIYQLYWWVVYFYGAYNVNTGFL